MSPDRLLAFQHLEQLSHEIVTELLPTMGVALAQTNRPFCWADSCKFFSNHSRWAVVVVIHVSLIHATLRGNEADKPCTDPKHIWSPSGGWWSRPKNWASNTAFCAVGIVGITAWVWSISAELETRDKQPTRWIPSMLVRLPNELQGSLRSCFL